MAKFTSEQMYNVPWVTTRYGKFNLNEPVFDIRDIAHALAQICRFNGQISKFYSVAQHSMTVGRLMEDYNLGDPLEGLLHDATEAYLSDVPSPFKHMLPDWNAIDHRCEIALRKQFSLGDKTDGCKTADWLALYMEAHYFLRDAGAEFPDPHNLRKQALGIAKELPYWLHYHAAPKKPFEEVTADFLRLYDTWRNDWRPGT